MKQIRLFPCFIFAFPVFTILTACNNTGKQLTNEVQKQLIFSRQYFQKKIPLTVWRSNVKTGFGWSYTSGFYYQTLALAGKGFLKLTDSIKSKYFNNDGVTLFYSVTDKARNYLVKEHVDPVTKKPDTAWFQAYRFRSLEVDTFYKHVSGKFYNENGTPVVYNNIMEAVFKVHYTTTPLFEPEQNPRSIKIFFETNNNGKNWELQSNFPKAYLIIGVYNPLESLNSCTNYYEDNIIFPSKLKKWLEQWWLQKYFNRFQ